MPAVFESLCARVDDYNRREEGFYVAMRPRSYLDMLAFFKALLAEKREALDSQVSLTTPGARLAIAALTRVLINCCSRLGG